jgi:hypothetical protein
LATTAAPFLQTTRTENPGADICVRADAILAALNAKLLTALTIEGSQLNGAALGEPLETITAHLQRG